MSLDLKIDICVYLDPSRTYRYLLFFRKSLIKRLNIRPFLFFEDPARSSKKKGKGIQILVSPSQTSIYVMCPTDHDIYIQVQMRLVVSDILATTQRRAPRSSFSMGKEVRVDKDYYYAIP